MKELESEENEEECGGERLIHMHDGIVPPQDAQPHSWLSSPTQHTMCEGCVQSNEGGALSKNGMNYNGKYTIFW